MVRATALTIALCLASIAAHAETSRFDLICTGEQKDGLEAPKTPHSVHYRIDLNEKRYCEGECQIGLPIKDVTTDAIMLADDTTLSPLWSKERIYISRTAGEVHTVVSSLPGHGYYWYSFDGKCEPHPFSGMPSPKF